MLFIKRHKIQNSGPGPQEEGYAIYDTSLLSQYVAYDSEDSVSTRIDYIKHNNFQSIYTYIPQFFTGTDNVNREFIRANYSGPTISAVPYQWSLIEICFAPYSGHPDYSAETITEGIIDLSDTNEISLGIHLNDNEGKVFVELGYTGSTTYDETLFFFNAHYDGTRVLNTLFLVFIDGKVRGYLGVDDGFDESDDYTRLINSNVAYLHETNLYESSYISNANNIASFDLYPNIGNERTYDGIVHNPNARVYSVRKFSGMGNLANNSLDRTFAQHFEVDKYLFLRDAVNNHGGN